jgi:L-fuconolactonase
MTSMRAGPTRRSVLIAGAAAAGAAGGAVRAQPLELIDVHPHIIAKDLTRYPSQSLEGRASDWSRTRPQTFEQLVAEMDMAGVTKAAIVQASTFHGFDNAYVADSVAKNPARFTGVCSINVLAPDAPAVLDGWLRRGMTGLRIFTTGAVAGTDTDWLASPKALPVWDRAAERGITVCVQGGPDIFPTLRGLLARYPRVKVLLDHAGRPALEDGPPYAQARPVFDLAAYPNLYLKVTSRTFAWARTGKATPETFFPRLVAAFGANRLAWGSNLPSDEGPMTKLVLDARASLASLSAADRAQIFAGTAKRLYPALA